MTEPVFRGTFQPPETKPKPVEPQEGDWVQVYGQVAPRGRVHPEDVVVTLYSHSDEYEASVRKDRVIKCDPPEGIYQRCTAMRAGFVIESAESTFIRCGLHYDHGGQHLHKERNICWPDSHTDGYFEER